MSVIDLILRRFSAFLIDSGILLIPLIFAALASLFGKFVWNDHVNLIVLTLAMFYFTMFEGHNDGQTPGKYLLGIRIRQASGAKIGFNEAFLRNASVICIPVLSYLLYIFILDVIHLIRSTFLLSLIIALGGIVLWPVSILLGSARVGMHDLIAGTQVTPVSSNRATKLKISAYQHVAGSILITVFICVATNVPLNFVTAQLKRNESVLISKTDRMQLLSTYNTPRRKEYFSGQIKNLNTYLEDFGFSPQLNDHTEFAAELGTFTFTKSPIRGAEELFSELRPQMRKIARYSFWVTKRGFFSADFRTAAAMIVLRRAEHSGAVYVFDYILRGPTYPLTIDFRRSLIGAIVQQDEKRVALFLAEPDHFAGFIIGVKLTIP